MHKIFKGIIYAILVVNVGVTAQVKVEYKPSNKLFRNPERGFYTQLTSQAEESPLSLSTLEAIKAKGESLILRMYYLKPFRDCPISDRELDLIRNDFSTIRQAGMKAIVRFAYSEEIGEQDAPLKIVLEHISQLKPILESSSDVIAVLQAGFIGAWGEWHSSTHGLDSISNMRRILYALLEALPVNRMIQVRTPRYVREIFNCTDPIKPSQAYNESFYSRVGFHNDCFLANWNDYGTYIDTTLEKKYLSEETKFTPMGGETCNPSSYANCSNAIYQLRKFHWSFLNNGYNPDVINGWIENGCYDDIARNLGYRLQLLSGDFDSVSHPNGRFKFRLKLTNVGYASMYNPRNVEIVIESKSNQKRYFVSMPVDPRMWQPGDTISLSGVAGLPENIPNGTYSVFLNLPDPDPRLHNNPDYSVRFANENVWEPHFGYNLLLSNFVINDRKKGPNYTGLYYFQSINDSSKTTDDKGTEN
jgi:hypothetical protein